MSSSAKPVDSRREKQRQHRERVLAEQRAEQQRKLLKKESRFLCDIQFRNKYAVEGMLCVRVREEGTRVRRGGAGQQTHSPPRTRTCCVVQAARHPV